METIRDMEPPPHIVGIQHFVDYKSVDEILKSKDFRQGSHQESQPFFGGSLLTIDHGEHFDRRRLEAPLFRKEALEYYEKSMKINQNALTTPITLMKCARLYELENDYQNALNSYNTIKTEYPESEISKNIDKFINKLKYHNAEK